MEFLFQTLKSPREIKKRFSSSLHDIYNDFFYIVLHLNEIASKNCIHLPTLCIISIRYRHFWVYSSRCLHPGRRCLSTSSLLPTYLATYLPTYLHLNYLIHPEFIRVKSQWIGTHCIWHYIGNISSSYLYSSIEVFEWLKVEDKVGPPTYLPLNYIIHPELMNRFYCIWEFILLLH